MEIWKQTLEQCLWEMRYFFITKTCDFYINMIAFLWWFGFLSTWTAAITNWVYYIFLIVYMVLDIEAAKCRNVLYYDEEVELLVHLDRWGCRRVCVPSINWPQEELRETRCRMYMDILLARYSRYRRGDRLLLNDKCSRDILRELDRVPEPPFEDLAETFLFKDPLEQLVDDMIEADDIEVQSCCKRIMPEDCYSKTARRRAMLVLNMVFTHMKYEDIRHIFPLSLIAWFEKMDAIYTYIRNTYTLRSKCLCLDYSREMLIRRRYDGIFTWIIYRVDGSIGTMKEMAYMNPTDLPFSRYNPTMKKCKRIMRFSRRYMHPSELLDLYQWQVRMTHTFENLPYLSIKHRLRLRALHVVSSDLNGNNGSYTNTDDHKHSNKEEKSCLTKKHRRTKRVNYSGNELLFDDSTQLYPPIGLERITLSDAHRFIKSLELTSLEYKSEVLSFGDWWGDPAGRELVREFLIENYVQTDSTMPNITLCTKFIYDEHFYMPKVKPILETFNKKKDRQKYGCREMYDIVLNYHCHDYNDLFRWYCEVDCKNRMLTPQKIRSMARQCVEDKRSLSDTLELFRLKMFLPRKLDIKDWPINMVWIQPYLTKDHFHVIDNIEGAAKRRIAGWIESLQKRILNYVENYYVIGQMDHRERKRALKARSECFKEIMRSKEAASMFLKHNKKFVCNYIQRTFAKPLLHAFVKNKLVVKLKNKREGKAIYEDRTKSFDAKYAHLFNYNNYECQSELTLTTVTSNLFMACVCFWIIHNWKTIVKCTNLFNKYVDLADSTAETGLEFNRTAMQINNTVSDLTSMYSNLVQNPLGFLQENSDPTAKVMMLEIKSAVHCLSCVYFGNYSQALAWVSNFTITRQEQIGELYNCVSSYINEYRSGIEVNGIADMGQHLMQIAGLLFGRSFSDEDLRRANSQFAFANHCANATKNVTNVFSSVVSFLCMSLFGCDPLNAEYQKHAMFLVQVIAFVDAENLESGVDQEKLQIIIDMYEKASKASRDKMSEYVPRFLQTRFLSAFHILAKRANEAKAILEGTAFRTVPFCIMFTGPPGVGKSHAIEYMQSADEWLDGRRYDKSMTYAFNGDSEYWEGYDGQKNILMDDMAKSDDIDQRRVEGNAVIGIVNVAPYAVNMAFGEKGKKFCTSKRLYISTNEANNGFHYATWEIGLKDKDAFKRRIHVAVHKTTSGTSGHHLWTVHKCDFFPEYLGREMSLAQLALLMKSHDKLFENQRLGWKLDDDFFSSEFKLFFNHQLTTSEHKQRWEHSLAKQGIVVEGNTLDDIFSNYRTSKLNEALLGVSKEKFKQVLHDIDDEYYCSVDNSIKHRKRNYAEEQKEIAERISFLDNFNEEYLGDINDPEIPPLLHGDDEVETQADSFWGCLKLVEEYVKMGIVKMGEGDNWKYLLVGLVASVSCVSIAKFCYDMTIPQVQSDTKKKYGKKYHNFRRREARKMRASKKRGGWMPNSELIMEDIEPNTIPEAIKTGTNDAQQSICAKLAHSLVWLDASNGFVTNVVNALHIKDGYMITAAHFLVPFAKGYPIRITMTNHLKQSTSFFMPSDYIQLDEQDIIMFRLPAHVSLPKASYSKLMNPLTYMPHSFVGHPMYLVTARDGVLRFRHLPCMDGVGDVRYDYEGERFVLEDPLRYHADTTVGDSGGLLIHASPSNQIYIAGIHVARQRTSGIALGIPLCKDDIDNMLMADDYEVNSEFKVIKTVDNPHYISRVNKIQRSKLFGWAGKATRGPAVMRAVEGVHGDPLDIAKEKLHSVPSNFPPVEKGVIDYIFDHYKPDYDTYRGILTWEEALRGNSERNIPSICAKTSPGWPYNYSGGKKTDYINIIELDNQITYDYKPDFLEQLKAEDAKLRKGEDIDLVWCDVLKAELRKWLKIMEGKTRLFGCCPLNGLFHYRRYFGALEAWLIFLQLTHHISVGTNPHGTDPTVYHQRLTKYGKSVVAGDYSNYDGGIPRCVAEAFLEFCNKWYDDGEEERNARRILVKNMYEAKRISGATIYQTYDGNPSGNPITSVYNSIANIIMMVSVLMYDLGIEDFDMVCFGDDNVVAADRDLTCGDFAPHLERRFGMKYTHCSKLDENLDKLDSIADITYLGRTFRKEGAVYRAPLSITTICESTYYVGKSLPENELLLQVSQSFFIELAHHPRSVYEHYSYKFLRAVKERVPEIYSAVKNNFKSWDWMMYETFVRERQFKSYIE
jgi:hypothetical protein